MSDIIPDVCENNTIHVPASTPCDECDVLREEFSEALTASQEAAASAQESETNASNSAESAAQSAQEASEAAEVAIEAATNQYVLYGAKWDRTTNKLTRLYGAQGITTDTTNFVHKGSLNANYSNPFDEIYPWSEMTVCNVNLDAYRNRTGDESLTEFITAVYGDPDFTYNGTDKVFVGRYVPEFWYRSSEDSDGNVTFLVSPTERVGFNHSEERIDGISFVVDDKTGNNTYTAGQGVPISSIALSTIQARARNSGFKLQNIRNIDSIITLYLVEFANMNIQQAIGSGCSSLYKQSASDIIANVDSTGTYTVFDVTGSFSTYIYVGTQLSFGTSTGATTYRAIVKEFSVNDSTYTITLDRNIGIADGMHISVHGMDACEFPLIGASVGNGSGYIGTDTKANAYYRGAVLFANRYSYILGIYREKDTNHIWLCPESLDPDGYTALNTSVHTDTGIALPTLSNGSYVTVGGNAQRISGLSAFMATGTSSGNSTSPVGDQQYVPTPATQNTILLFGGASHIGWNCGVFCGYWNHASGLSYWDVSALPFLPKGR